jgi:hypothetical protein
MLKHNYVFFLFAMLISSHNLCGIDFTTAGSIAGFLDHGYEADTDSDDDSCDNGDDDYDDDSGTETDFEGYDTDSEDDNYDGSISRIDRITNVFKNINDLGRFSKTHILVNKHQLNSFSNALKILNRRKKDLNNAEVLSFLQKKETLKLITQISQLLDICRYNPKPRDQRRAIKSLFAPIHGGA